MYSQILSTCDYDLNEVVLYIDKEFYFRGCGWKVKKVKWSMDDMKWMQEMCSLFDKLFGPDKFQFKTLQEMPCNPQTPPAKLHL